AMLSHAGSVDLELGDAPGVLLIVLCLDAAVVNGCCTCPASLILASLCEARRCKRGNREPQSEHRQTTVTAIMTRLPTFKGCCNTRCGRVLLSAGQTCDRRDASIIAQAINDVFAKSQQWKRDADMYCSAKRRSDSTCKMN